MRCFVTGICYQTLTFDCDECGGGGVPIQAQVTSLMEILVGCDRLLWRPGWGSLEALSVSLATSQRALG